MALISTKFWLLGVKKAPLPPVPTTVLPTPTSTQNLKPGDTSAQNLKPTPIAIPNWRKRDC